MGTIGRCDRTPVCDEGSCEAGRCQRDPLTLKGKARLDHGDFEASVAIDWALEAGPEGPDTRLRIWPSAPLEPHARHTLALGAAITDRSGAALEDDAGARSLWRRDFVTAGPGSSGPEAQPIAPAPGEVAVPRNLAAVVARFPRPVVIEPSARLELIDDEGGALGLVDPSPCPGYVPGICVEWRVEGALRAATGYRIGGGTLRDLEGRRVVPGPAASRWFTGEGRDDAPPELEGLEVELRGRCVHARGFAGEVVALRIRRDDAGSAAISGVGAIEAALRIDDPTIAPGDPFEVIVEAVDRAGNQSSARATLSAGPAFDPAAPALAIAEVLANPAGDEPRQEFVELVDLRAEGEPRAARGLRIVDRPWDEIAAAIPGGVILGAVIPDFATAPGERAVIVGASHDLQDPDDPQPPAGAPVIRLPGALGSGGLGNMGEPITVYDPASGALIASYSAPLPSNKGEDQGRSVVLVGAGGCDTGAAWAYHPFGSSSPGVAP
ncbi:MAG: hypothetical protein R3B09_18625 [Nannocystaceae bacterium]